MAVPVVSLADRDVITGNRRRDRPPVLRGRGTDEIGALLDRAGDLRQVGRSSGFAIQMMGSSDGEHLLYEAIMDTLGYRFEPEALQGAGRGGPRCSAEQASS